MRWNFRAQVARSGFIPALQAVWKIVPKRIRSARHWSGGAIDTARW